MGLGWEQARGTRQAGVGRVKDTSQPGLCGTRWVMRGSTRQGVLGWALTAEAVPISLLAVCPGVSHPHGWHLGQPRGCCREPCSALSFTGSSGKTWSPFLGM